MPLPALLIVGLASCASPSADSGSGPTGALRPIPLDVVFANPAVRHPRLSPDGRRIAWIADRDGTPNVWTRTLDGGPARPVTSESEDGIDAFTWSANGGSIVYLKDRDGDRRYGLFGVDPATGATTVLASFENAQVHVLGVAESRPHEVLLSMNRENEERFDVYRLDTRTGELSLEIENPGFLGSPSGPQATWHVDRDLEVRAALGERADGGVDLYALTAGEWVRIGSWSLELGEPVVVSAGAERLWLLDPRDGNTARLRSVGLDGDAGVPVAGDSVYDVDAVLMAPGSDEPLAAAVYRERRAWTALDPSVRDDFAALERVCAGDLSIVSRAAGDRLWVAACDRSDSPGSYLLLRRDAGTVETLFVRRPGLEDYRLAPKEPVRFEARDGLPIHGYMTLPPGLSRDDLPTVVLVHGGPWARDKSGYDSTVQWLASRGYLVLQVNFRGSTGYGHRFAARGRRELGGAMQDDVTDGLRWAVGEGLVDPERVAIMGGSYGGYAALAGLAFTPDLYRAGISIVGFGNLITLMERVAPMFQSSVSFFHSYVGHPETDGELLRRRSPFFHVDSIRAPVLMAHGRNDPLVPVEESEAMARALEARGVPVELVVWPDEGHGLTNPANRLSFYGLAERFLACHVLGREAACPPGADER